MMSRRLSVEARNVSCVCVFKKKKMQRHMHNQMHKEKTQEMCQKHKKCVLQLSVCVFKNTRTHIGSNNI